jgi:hypothetical protein
LAFARMTKERFEEIMRGAAALKAARKPMTEERYQEVRRKVEALNEAERKMDDELVAHAQQVLAECKFSEPVSVETFLKHLDNLCKQKATEDRCEADT